MGLVKRYGRFIVVNHQRFGLTAVTERIEKLFLFSVHLHGKGYNFWTSLEESDRKKFLKEIRDVIKHEMFGEKFLTALAKDVLGEDIAIDSFLFKYLRSHVYRGDTRGLLTDLQTILTDMPAQRGHSP